MKTLIFLASPNKNGNSAKIVELLHKEIKGDMEIVNVYNEKIGPCIDCKYCYTHEDQCSIKDNMTRIYSLINSCDNIIIVSPLYFSGFPSPMKSIIDRAQVYWSKEYIFKRKKEKNKRGILIVASGNKGNAILIPIQTIAKHFFNTIGANLVKVIHAEDTDNISVDENKTIKEEVIELARNIENI